LIEAARGHGGILPARDRLRGLTSAASLKRVSCSSSTPPLPATPRTHVRGLIEAKGFLGGPENRGLTPRTHVRGLIEALRRTRVTSAASSDSADSRARPH